LIYVCGKLIVEYLHYVFISFTKSHVIGKKVLWVTSELKETHNHSTTPTSVLHTMAAFENITTNNNSSI